jgi:hypothetical protein
MGTAGRWLTSQAFDLPTEGRPFQAADVLDEAAVALSDPSFGRKKARALDKRLREVLGDTDPFWTRWRFVGEQRGWLSPVTGPDGWRARLPPKSKRKKKKAKAKQGPR